MRSILALCLLAVPAALVADDKKQADDLKAMVGTWTIEKAEQGGNDLTVPLQGATLTVTADGKYTFKFGPEEDAGTVAVDGTKSPKEMNIKGVEGPNKGKTFKTIYKIDGDTATVCYELGGGDRPTKFETKAGTMLFLVTYKKAKK